MTLLRETPRDHGILLDHDRRGNRRLSVTGPGRGNRRGKSLRSATGELYGQCFSHVSEILKRRHRLRLQPQDLEAKQFYPVSEECAEQTLLLLEAMERTEGGESLGRLVAEMHPAEAGWWYVNWRNRGRGKRVMRALALMYG